ncbi:MAG TPA: MraY family glycosyltransferase [Actinomycetota bacterium]
MAFVIAFLVTLVAMPLCIVAGTALGLVDRPSDDGLKIHVRPVPLTGGVAVAAGAVVGLAVAEPVPWWLPTAVGLALIVGAADDARPLSPWIRIAVQGAAGAVLVIGGVRFEALGIMAAAAVVLATLACANAVNLMDGQDGLAGGLSAIAAAGLLLTMPDGGDGGILAVALCGSLVAFLFWNRPPARVFLGNGGAYAVGVVLAVLTAPAGRAGWTGLLAAAVCLGPFAYELASTVVRRVARGRSLAIGDRGHAYDVAAERLGGRTRSTVLFLFLGAASIPVAVGVSRGAPAVALVVTAAYAGALVLGDVVLRRPRSFTRKVSDEPAR